MTGIELNHNKLKGAIPESVGKLKNLNSFTVFSNWLSGTLPAGLLQLENLSFLQLVGNDIGGSVPAVANQNLECKLFGNAFCVPQGQPKGNNPCLREVKECGVKDCQILPDVWWNKASDFIIKECPTPVPAKTCKVRVLLDSAFVKEFPDYRTEVRNLFQMPQYVWIRDFGFGFELEIHTEGVDEHYFGGSLTGPDIADVNFDKINGNFMGVADELFCAQAIVTSRRMHISMFLLYPC